MDEIDIEYANVQGGVFKPHGRNFSAILIFNWRNGSALSERVRWLKELSWRVTTHKKQLESIERQNNAKKEGKEIQETFLTVGLGQDHFKQLGVNIGSDEYWVNPESTDDAKMYIPRDVNPSENFDIKTSRTVVVIIAHDDEIRLKNEVKALIKMTKQANLYDSKSFAVHYGIRSGFFHPLAKKIEKGLAMDPFGFVDGITDIKDKSKIAKIAFSDDLKTDEGKVFKGSYLAMMKFWTNLEKFEDSVDAIANIVKVNDVYNEEDVRYAKALLMGRYPNGESIMMAPREDGAPPLEHSIAGFNKDSQGLRCPLGAHTRVVHTSFNEVDPKGIIRRSVPYYQWKTHKKMKSVNKRVVKNRGLLFLSFQRSLRGQFMPIIQEMINKKDSVGYYRNSATPERHPIAYYDKKDKKDKEIITGDGYLNFTKMLGQQFFFFPELSFLTKEVK